MDDGASSSYVLIFGAVLLVAIGWLIGRMFPWAPSKKGPQPSFDRVSGDGGIDYLLHNVDYTVTKDSSKRAKVELKGHLYDVGRGESKLYISAEAGSPSPVADEMHRIHNAGVMICSLRPAEKETEREGKNGDRPPVIVDLPEQG